jgi:NAD(P)H-nitrite reductase large subunit
MDEQEIIDGLKAVCLCKGIRRRTFLALIADGKRTLHDLQQATGAGSGPCGGKRCTPRILELLAREVEEDNSGTDRF